MSTCRGVGRELTNLAARRPTELPDWVRDHVAACPACARRLAAARLACGLVAAGGEILSPPQGFADRVRTAIVGRSVAPPQGADDWRAAWGLLPTFAAAVAALAIVYQTSEVPGPTGFFPTEGLTAGEHLVLDSSAPDADEVLGAVLEGTGR